MTILRKLPHPNPWGEEATRISHSREVFDHAQQIVNGTEDCALRNLLRDTLATRDQVTAGLAKRDAAALSETQRVLSKPELTAKH